MKNLSPDAEVIIEVNDIATGNHISDTYDVSFALTENEELKLQVAVEMSITNT